MSLFLARLDTISPTILTSTQHDPNTLDTPLNCFESVGIYNIFMQSCEEDVCSDTPTTSAASKLRDVIIKSEDTKGRINLTISAVHVFACEIPLGLDYALHVFVECFANLPDSVEQS